MDNYWCPQNITNPNLKNDLIEFFLRGYDEKVAIDLIDKHEYIISVICDKLEFVNKLLYLKEYFKSISKNEIKEVKVIDNNNVIVKCNNKIIFMDKEFDGITYDIDALCQYLLLTLVDTIAGYNGEKDKGVGERFREVFRGLSDKLKNRILSSYIISRVDLGKINEADCKKWNNLDEKDQYKEIVSYFYKVIRCGYTHQCHRSFVCDLPIVCSLGHVGNVHVSKVDPKLDNLILLFHDVVKEAFLNKFIGQ